METLPLTRVVADRPPQDNFQFPPEVRALVQELTGYFGKKEKWMVGAAAFLLLRERSEEEVRQLVGEVNSAHFHRKLPELISAAKEKAQPKKPHRPGVFARIAAKKGDPTKGE